VIALFFLACIISVLGSMLRLPEETERTRAATYAVHSVWNPTIKSQEADHLATQRAAKHAQTNDV